MSEIISHSELAEIPTEALHYVQYRHKGSSEKKYLLKCSSVVGFDVKCALCKIGLKMEDVLDHFQKSKHMKKLLDVAEFYLPVTVVEPDSQSLSSLNANEEEVLAPLIPSETVSSSTVNQQEQEAHETVATSTTTSKDVSTSSVALCKTTTETLLEKTRKISSQQLTDINIQVNSEVFSGEQLDLLKPIFSELCKYNLSQVEHYDNGNDWKILLVQVPGNFAWCLHKTGKIATCLTNSTLTVSAKDRNQCSLLVSVHRRITEEPRILPLNASSSFQLIWRDLDVQEEQVNRNEGNSQLEVLENMNAGIEDELAKKDEVTVVDEKYEPKAVIPTSEVIKCSPKHNNEDSEKTKDSSDEENQTEQNNGNHLSNIIDNLTVDKFVSTSNQLTKKSDIEFSHKPDPPNHQIMPLEVFISKYNELKIDDILEIQYKNYLNQWNFLITSSRKKYRCTLCSVYVGSGSNVLTHVKGFLHNQNMKYILDLHHPLYRAVAGKSQSENNQTPPSNEGIPVEPVTVCKKVTLQEFKLEYTRLNNGDLLLVQYRLDVDWHHMIVTENAQYWCHLCDNLHLGKASYIKTHIKGSRHLKNLDRVIEMSQPLYSISSKKPSQKREFELSDNHKKCTVKQFKQLYLEFDVMELMKIQYRFQSKDWYDLIVTDGVRYICNLCGHVPLGGAASIKLHISGVRHSTQMDNITEIHHPLYSIRADCSSDNENKTIGNRLGLFGHRPVVTLEQFKYEYLKLNAADIVHIQYRVNQDDWSYMISTRVNEVRCNLCGNVSLGNIENIIPHIRSKRHMENMNRVIQMFHPSFTILDDEPNLNYDSQSRLEFTLEEFKEECKNLNIEDLLEVQYRLNDGSWDYMIVVKKTRYFCNLCGNLYIGDANSVIPHIASYRHHCSARDIVEMFHPFYSIRGAQDIPTPEYNLRRQGSRLWDREWTPEEFLLEHMYLDIENLLEVQYRPVDSYESYFMITEIAGQFNCNLCGIGGFNTREEITAHVRSGCHFENTKYLFAIHHPTFWSAEENGDFLNVGSDVRYTSAENILGPKEFIKKWTIEIFQSQYISWDHEHILKIQYQAADTGKWYYMIVHESGQYICNLCGRMNLMGRSRIHPHVRSKIHTDNVNSIDIMYHPVYGTVRKVTETNAAASISPSQYASEDDLSEVNQIWTTTEFKRMYVELDIKQLLEVQYQEVDSETWTYMVTQHSAGFTCNLCGITKFRNVRSLYIHFGRGYHINKLRCVSAMHHPFYCSAMKQDILLLNRSNRSNSVESLTSSVRSYEESRLEEFKIQHIQLEVGDLLEIQYQTYDSCEWRSMIEQMNGRYICSLCYNISLRDEEGVLTHIRSNFHSVNLDRISAMHHPSHYPRKILPPISTHNSDNMAEYLCLYFNAATTPDEISRILGQKTMEESSEKSAVVGYTKRELKEIERNTQRAIENRQFRDEFLHRNGQLRTDCNIKDGISNALYYKLVSKNLYRSPSNLSKKKRFDAYLSELKESENIYKDLTNILRPLSALENILGTLGVAATQLISYVIKTRDINMNFAKNAILNEEILFYLNRVHDELPLVIDVGIFNSKELLTLRKVIHDITVFFEKYKR